MKPYTINQYIAKDSFVFTEDIHKEDTSLAMASLDLDSLFTNIPLKVTIDIYRDLLFDSKEAVDGLFKADFRELLTIAITESFILFDGRFFQQTDGVAMGSPFRIYRLRIFFFVTMNATGFPTVQIPSSPCAISDM